jgi:hypothetical protein
MECKKTLGTRMNGVLTLFMSETICRLGGDDVGDISRDFFRCYNRSDWGWDFLITLYLLVLDVKNYLKNVQICDS